MNEAELALKEKLESYFYAEKVNILDMQKIGHDIVNGLYDEYDLKEIKREIDNSEIGGWVRNGEISNIFCASFYQLMVLLEPSPESIIAFLEYIRATDFDRKQKYTLWAICRAFMFLMPTTYSKESYKKYLEVYLEIADEYKKAIQFENRAISYNERNHDFVIFITAQFIDFVHGPTKSCFFRAKALNMVGKKQVMIINTNDLLPKTEGLPLFWQDSHNSNDELDEIDYLNDGEVKIPFFQIPSVNEADVNSIEVVLKTIEELKPEYIVNIGGFNITASLANDMIPVMLVGMAPGQLQYDGTDYFTCSLSDLANAKDYARYLGAKEDSLIPSVFTSDFKMQREKHTREEFGIPSDSIVACIVGSRLDVEVDRTFIDFLCSLDDIVVLFMGRFHKYDRLCLENEEFKQISQCMGFVNDILSYMDLCDIYINPRRLGGGTSAVEAMSKGVIPVTLDYGDVSYNVGDEFTVNSYAEMRERISKFAADKEYRSEMSKKAIKRAEYLCDTKNRFIETTNELEKRIADKK
ncbi:MAG: glycosyltransferase family 4 protein [Butyrivibrio sp.]|nr:glycosyltransferase family 4 protein [Butyrivibrio sp.]